MIQHGLKSVAQHLSDARDLGDVEASEDASNLDAQFLTTVGCGPTKSKTWTVVDA